MRPGSFTSLRISLLSALGFGAIHCGGRVEILDSSSGGQGGAGSQNSSASTNNSTATSGPGGAGGSTGCDNAVPITTADGSYLGFAKCPDGTIHRVEPVACDTTINMAACSGMEEVIECTKDADCTAGTHGKCVHLESTFEGAWSLCGCAYSCADDTECSPGHVCVCNGVVNTGESRSSCAPANCVTGADCPSGECGITSYNDGCTVRVELACRSAADVCRADVDCDPGSTCVTIYGSGEYSCEYQNCAVGRPLLVAGQARVAPAAARSDWSDASIDPALDMLPDVREALAAHWSEIAALEHASIASFARFSMELLTLGAPPPLLLEAQRAAADEVEHARIAYGLASAYGGRPVGPAPLDLTSVSLAVDRRAVIRGLIEEACVGETLGVAEALAIGSDVKDPALSSVLARIATDEQRHAELAWRTLRWLLNLNEEGGEGNEELRRFASDVFDRAIDAAERDPAPRRGVASRDHGLLSHTELGALRRQALREVVRPCARALLAEDQPIARGPIVYPADST